MLVHERYGRAEGIFYTHTVSMKDDAASSKLDAPRRPAALLNIRGEYLLQFCGQLRHNRTTRRK